MRRRVVIITTTFKNFTREDGDDEFDKENQVRVHGFIW